MVESQTYLKQIQLSLTAVVVIASEATPKILIHTTQDSISPHASHNTATLPESLFNPSTHRTFEESVRENIYQFYGLKLGYVEQLYTFGDRNRNPNEAHGDGRAISVGYIALTRTETSEAPPQDWHDWYTYFPWEDWRKGRPDVIDGLVLPRLQAWIEDSDSEQQRIVRSQRTALCFGSVKPDPDAHWDNERVLERYELLYSANLIPEARANKGLPDHDIPPAMGRAMTLDHRRILATAITRIRGKIKYRPVIFEMVPKRFTLLQLQQVVESLAGIPLHKQNFRRLVEQQGLVDRTHEYETTGRGRPAELFKFRSAVILERPAPGVRSGYQSSLSIG